MRTQGVPSTMAVHWETRLQAHSLEKVLLRHQKSDKNKRDQKILTIPQCLMHPCTRACAYATNENQVLIMFLWFAVNFFCKVVFKTAFIL